MEGSYLTLLGRTRAVVDSELSWDASVPTELSEHFRGEERVLNNQTP
jgi:hypothetical protein